VHQSLRATGVPQAIAPVPSRQGSFQQEFNIACEFRLDLTGTGWQAKDRKMEKKCAEDNFVDIQQAYERAKELCR
jgi:hypothetical protein